MPFCSILSVPHQPIEKRPAMYLLGLMQQEGESFRDGEVNSRDLSGAWWPSWAMVVQIIYVRENAENPRNLLHGLPYHGEKLIAADESSSSRKDWEAPAKD